jgi:methylmalonyl-CoA mutase cobalamin-binding subunit
MTDDRERERMVLPEASAAVEAEMLTASVRRIDLSARHGADPALLRRQAVRLAEQIFLHPDDAPRRALLERGRVDSGFGAALVTRILPETARRLEAGWESDRLSFVDVTIAAARLQDALRRLGRITLPPPDAPVVAMIVPPWEQHTLAAAFAAQAIRDRGAHVRAISGASAGRIADLVARMPVEGLLLSVGCTAALHRAPPLIAALRTATRRAVPVVAGGPGICDRVDRLKLSGADYVTNDMDAALSFCRIPLCRAGHAGATVDA